MTTPTADHMEIAAQIWAGMPDSVREQVLAGIKESVMDRNDDSLPFTEVVAEAFAIGFHFCMLSIESGALVKVGPGKPENN